MNARAIYVRYIYPVAVIAIFVSLLIARLLYPPSSPEPFSDIWDTISGLGKMENNPTGFWFFQASMVIVGILALLALYFVHPRLVPFKKKTVRFGSFWLLLGGVGFLLVGLVPAGTLEILFPDAADVYIVEKFHEISAALGTIGVMFAAFFYGAAIQFGKIPVNRKLNLIITIMWWGAIIAAVIAVGYGYILYDDLLDSAEWALTGAPWILSFGIWERVIFVVIFVYLGLVVPLVPERQAILAKDTS